MKENKIYMINNTLQKVPTKKKEIYIISVRDATLIIFISMLRLIYRTRLYNYQNISTIRCGYISSAENLI